MPPRPKITKAAIAAAGLALVRSEGADALNARAVARALGCSTQPVFSNYDSMDDLRSDVIAAANERYQRAIAAAMADPALPPYKASGMAYIRFAKEEGELFKLLFMRDRSGETITENREEVAPLLALIAKNLGIGEEEAWRFHLEMWIYVHGIATMAATHYLNWDEETVSAFLTDAYQGIRSRYQRKEEQL